MIRHTKNLARLSKIAWVFAKHDLLFIFREFGLLPILTRTFGIVPRFRNRKRPGERLCDALQELGPSFIKLGQTFSTRSDLLGDVIAEDLTLLQDRLPPFPFKDVKRVIEKELEAPLEEIFAEFDEKPVAAASIAQVHFATLHNGELVAVKVRRPNIIPAFKRDIELFYWLAEMLVRARPHFKRLKPVEMVREMEKTVAIEMDFRLEAAAGQELAENFTEEESFHVPLIRWKYTSEQVLTLSRIEGIRIGDIEQLKESGHDLDAIMEKASKVFFLMVYQHGFFHADMHPGNLFVRADGNLIAVDFGIMGRLNKKTRLFMAELLWAFLNRDYQRVAKIHFEAGFVPPHQDMQAFAQASRAVAEPILGLPQNEISIARLLSHLFKVAEDFEMETQPDLLLLQKTIMLAEGVGRQLNPNLNMWKLAEPFITDWAKENFSLRARVEDRIETLRYQLDDQLTGLLDVAEQLPKVVTKDGVKLHPDTVAALKAKTKKPFHVPGLLWLFAGVALGYAVFWWQLNG